MQRRPLPLLRRSHANRSDAVLRVGRVCRNGLAADKPNVIFILADDLGYGDLGCFGQKLIQTPNIDRLAAEGMRFTQAYAGATVCAPSRCSLMTGMHNGHAADPRQPGSASRKASSRCRPTRSPSPT